MAGEARDLRAQWALEETGLPYRVHALDYIAGERHLRIFVERSQTWQNIFKPNCFAIGQSSVRSAK